ncbi:MAG: hypothetical protein WBE86_11200 [Candidatus Acidiferrales bacterium]
MPVNGWMIAIFIVITISVVLQMLMLAGMFFQFRQTSREIHQAVHEMQKKVDPLLFRFGRIVENSEEKISSIVSDAAEMTRLARGQAQKIDRVVSDALERTRSQIIRADAIITGTLEAVEDAGVSLRRTVFGPLQQASAVLKGIRTGIDFIRGEHAARGSGASQPDEELFI